MKKKELNLVTDNTSWWKKKNLEVLQHLNYSGTES